MDSKPSHAPRTAAPEAEECLACLVVPTTHWDRAWYWPHERFRVKLVAMFVAVEELWRTDPDWVFTLDGQTIALCDYLEVFPEKAELYRRMGQAGRFRCGPFHVQNDWWCTGAESMIRNVQHGTRVAASFAAAQTAFYLPDTFGFPASLPMFARQCGADCVMLMRGLPAAVAGGHRLLQWACPDGSTVTLLHLRDGYANAARLGYTDGSGEVMDERTKASGIHPVFRLPLAVNKLTAAAEQMRDGQGVPRLLLAGVDHQIPQRELPDILAAATSTRLTFRYADLDTVAAAATARDPQGWPVLRGEADEQALGGTVSSRIHLKVLNRQGEALLAEGAEPACAVLSALGIASPAARILPLAWERLLSAQPHDDITGCGVDAVHRETEMQLWRGIQSGDAVIRQALSDLVRHHGGQRAGDQRHGIAVLESSGQGGPRRARLEIDFEGRNRWGDVRPSLAYRVVDETGRELPFVELSRGITPEHPHPKLVLEVLADLRPMALQRIFLEPQKAWTQPAEWTLSNEHLAVSVNADATIDLTEHATGRTWRGLGVLSDQADVGDSYTFAPLPGEAETLFSGLRWQRVALATGGGMQAIRMRGELPIPAGAHQGQRTAATSVPVEVVWSLAPGERQVGCRLRFSNTARDHRLRWNLPLHAQPAEYEAGIFCSRPQRAVTPPEQTPEGWLRYAAHPVDAYAVADGLAVFCPCPLVAEVVTGSAPRLALTILRATGMLSVSAPVATRGPGAGPDTPTPEGQCLRDYELTFAIRPCAATETDQLYAEALRWRRHLPHAVLWGADATWDGTPSPSLLACDDTTVALTACKPAADGCGVVVRWFNPGATARTITLRGALAQQLIPCDFLERPDGQEPCRADAAGVTSLTLPPLGLRSFRITAPAT
jgi:hypothetical protein